MGSGDSKEEGMGSGSGTAASSESEVVSGASGNAFLQARFFESARRGASAGKRKRARIKSGNGAASANSGNEVTVGNIAGADVQASALFDNLIWLSTKDAAIYLRKFCVDGKPSEGAIRNAVWRGFLKSRKWQRRLYFKKADLDRLLQNSPLSNGGFGWK
jgi:hypothetical protein